jgi:hypothetical protein
VKLFCKNIIQFAFFSVILFVLFQAIISFRINGKTVRGHDNLEQTSNVNADLVFIGSSRCWAHFDPVFFDTTYKLKSINIGVDGHSEISMAITRLKDYLSRNNSPKYVILSFDPFVSAGSFNNNTNFVHKNDFARYAFLPSKKDLLIVNYFKFDFYEKYIPLYAIFKYKLLLDAIYLKSSDNWSKYGYEMNNNKWDTILNPVKNIMKDFFFKKSDITSITNSLDSLNNVCFLNNTKLVCIQTPVYKVIHDDSTFSKTKSICSNLNIPFVDANKAYIRNNIKYFYNSNHLNKFGVGAMNAVLRSDTILASVFKQ